MAFVKKKKRLAAKGILAILLVGILTALILGFVLTNRGKDKSPAPQENPTELQTETASEESAEPESAAEPEEEPEPETEPKAPRPTAPAKSKDGKPVIVELTDENWALTLLNRHYALSPDYMPALSAAIEGSSVSLDSRIVPEFRAMYEAAKADGVLLTPYTGYRSYARQKENFRRKVEYFTAQGLSAQEAEQKACETVLPPGCSEYNSGLCVDIGKANSAFKDTKEYAWLLENAANYGFVLRYPEGKEAITGVAFLPFHWRYVGKDAAIEMKQENLTLEEYLSAV